ILHRDLKSLNVLLHEVNGELRAKVADFGFAVFKQNVKSSDAKGTLLWTDPGILQGKTDASKETDIYSLGMVLYELVSGQLPFHTLHADPAVLKQHILSGQRPVLPSTCPAELAKLIQACWSEDPKERPSALVVAERLEAMYQTKKEATVGAAFKQTASSEPTEPTPTKVLKNTPVRHAQDKDKEDLQAFRDTPSDSLSPPNGSL